MYDFSKPLPGWSGKPIRHRKPDKGPIADGFSAVPTDLRVGELYGYRLFHVDPMGYLTGVHQPQLWLPDQTIEAQCMVLDRWGYPDGPTFDFPPRTETVYETPAPDAFHMWVPEFSDKVEIVEVKHVKNWVWEQDGVELYRSAEYPHTLASLDCPHEDWESCLCGFYAYHHGVLQAYTTLLSPVVGVVALSGHVIVGQKGYRASRGRVVAVLDPRHDTRVIAQRTVHGRYYHRQRTYTELEGVNSPEMQHRYRLMADNYSGVVRVNLDDMVDEFEIGV
jgi:hypothetical protein